MYENVTSDFRVTSRERVLRMIDMKDETTLLGHGCTLQSEGKKTVMHKITYENNVLCIRVWSFINTRRRVLHADILF